MATRRSTTTRTPRAAAPIFVKVARTGGSVQEVCLNGGRLVSDALLAYGIDSPSSDDHVRVNGAPKELDHTLRSGDIVTIAGKISGG